MPHDHEQPLDVGEVTSPKTSAEIRISSEPFYPILNGQELPKEDLRNDLTEEVRKYLTPHERVVHIHYPLQMIPAEPLSAEAVCMKAARAKRPDEIGFNGPTVASINPFEDSSEESRYERQHGRDDLQAATDLYPLHPHLLDTTLVSLAQIQGVADESYIEGQPHRQEKPGSIILIDRSDDDPIGQKFSKYGHWAFPYYGSVDAPANFINGLSMVLAIDPSYLIRRKYSSLDGNEYTMNHAFDLSVQWLTDRTEENPEGLIEYHNPIKGGGIRNQGWRDSASAMMHADGAWANADNGIAPIEVQGFAYDAFRNAARIYSEIFNDTERAADLEARAQNLQKVILEKGFVQDARGAYFVSGWDRDENGKLRQLKVRTSAMGRLLGSNIVKSNDHEAQEMVFETVRTLLSPDLLTRWGLRTMSASEKGYVPFSYHIGPIWPHDTNEIAKNLSGLGLHGLDRYVGKTTTRLHEKTGLFYEHVSGSDSEEPEVPIRDTYVYNKLYDELYLFEQAPPIAQTWAASTELAKRHRYSIIPHHATGAQLYAFEAKLLRELEADSR